MKDQSILIEAALSSIEKCDVFMKGMSEDELHQDANTKCRYKKY